MTVGMDFTGFFAEIGRKGGGIYVVFIYMHILTCDSDAVIIIYEQMFI